MNNRFHIPLTLVFLLCAITVISWWVSRYPQNLPTPPPATAVETPQDRLEVNDAIARSGDVITTEGIHTLYYVAINEKRLVFPTDKTYETWYPQTARIKNMERAALESIPLGGNVTYRPGMRIITFESDPQFYVVAGGGVLRRTKEKLLNQYYGKNWRERVDTLPEYHRADYTIGPSVKRLSDYSPSGQYQQSITISHDKNLVPSLK